MNFNTSSVTEKEIIDELITRAFEEDVQSGDATTNAIVDEANQAEAVWVSKESGVVAGLDIAKSVFRKLDPNLKWQPKIDDGSLVERGSKIVELEGTARAILTGERIALNFAQRMSGIATLTRKFVNAVSDYPAQILDTRKTIPGFRLLDKYAVSAGGGTNHRMGLYDMAMIKDNHIIAAGEITEAVNRVRSTYPDLKIEVETTNNEQVKEALTSGADIIMLDNMSIKQMEESISIIDGQAQAEASGNITLENIKEVASTGVDFISVGALTHSVKAFDISQQIRQVF